LEVFCNVKVPNIPLKDQQSISRYLDEKIKYLDEKIKSTLSLKENLEKLKLQLVKNLFSVHNKTIRLKFIASIVKGEQINQALFTKDGSGYPFANGGKDYSGFYSSYNNEACSVSMSEGGEYAGTIL
jgi:type I restriction enzyme S subunit